MSSGLLGSIDPLPRGPHDLSRQQVATVQRRRLALAMAHVCADTGYATTSVSAVLRRAGMSRLTFYELYDGKLDCFLDALTMIGDALFEELEASMAGGRGTGVERAAAVLDHYLDTISNDLALARLYIVEAHAAGPLALERRAALHHRVAVALGRLVGADDDQRLFACEAYVASVSALVALPVVTADVAALRALRAPLVDLLVRMEASGIVSHDPSD